MHLVKHVSNFKIPKCGNENDEIIEILSICSFVLNFPFRFASNAALARAIENAESPLNPNDPDLLLLKAISAASTQCLFQCMNLLQRHQEIIVRPESAA